MLYFLSDYIEDSFEQFNVTRNILELESVIKSIEDELAEHGDESERDKLNQNLLLILTGHQRLSVYILDESGRVVYGTQGPNLALARAHDEFDEIVEKHYTTVWHNEDKSYRLAASCVPTSHNEGEFTIIAAINRDLQLNFLQYLHEGLRSLIVISCILTLFGSVLTIYITQKPINRLIKKIEGINSKRLNYRISTATVPTKYIGLVEAFNNMVSGMEDVFRRQNEFTGDIAHEIRTPITNLITQTQIALNNKKMANEDYREILYSNLEEYERLSKMTTDMLFLARADNNLITPELHRIDLNSLFTDVLEYFEPLCEDNQISMQVNGSGCQIEGDRLMITRAINNIIFNAIRYTPQGKQITITLKQINHEIVSIEIANPGKKIPPEHLPHLFERFYRIDKSRKRNGEGGFGIGLAIVKSIITTHKGQIAVESDDISTRFIITLPAAPMLANGK